MPNYRAFLQRINSCCPQSFDPIICQNLHHDGHQQSSLWNSVFMTRFKVKHLIEWCCIRRVKFLAFGLRFELLACASFIGLHLVHLAFASSSWLVPRSLACASFFGSRLVLLVYSSRSWVVPHYHVRSCWKSGRGKEVNIQYSKR